MNRAESKISSPSMQTTSPKISSRRFSIKVALATSALFLLVYFIYYYYAASQNDRLTLTKPKQLESVRLLRYYSPEWYGLFQSNLEIAQIQYGERLFIIPKPMGVFTGHLVLALPIPSAYRTSYQDIARSEQADGSLMPLNAGHPPALFLQINRLTGHVCYKAYCAQLSSICPPAALLGKAGSPDCQFFKH